MIKKKKKKKKNERNEERQRERDRCVSREIDYILTDTKLEGEDPDRGRRSIGVACTDRYACRPIRVHAVSIHIDRTPLCKNM